MSKEEVRAAVKLVVSNARWLAALTFWWKWDDVASVVVEKLLTDDVIDAIYDAIYPNRDYR